VTKTEARKARKARLLKFVLEGNFVAAVKAAREEDASRGPRSGRLVDVGASLRPLLTAERKPSARSIQLSDPLAESNDRHRTRALRPRERSAAQKLLGRYCASP
jgi:hypothetical protein